MKQKKVSLKDIALKAGVSTALVSYVLNGKEKESRVGKDIAIKIRAIAQEFKYQPNHVAKSLRSGTTKTIGLIIADISNPFFSNIARIVEDEAKKQGYTVIFGSSDENHEKSADLFNVMINRQVDGFIIVPAENSEQQISDLIDNSIPFVLLDRHFPGIKTDYVAIDNFKASFTAVEHLVNGGYQKVAMIAYVSEQFHMKERINGYKAVFDAKNLLFQERWLKRIAFNRIDEEIQAAIDDLVYADQPVEAMIFATYSLAISGLKYINKIGLKVPNDIAVVSFGQADAFDLYYCPITYLRQPMAELGKTAVDLLLNKFKNPEAQIQQVIMEAQLITRDSSKAKVAI
jgi:LacI family transcriptional regulator